MLKTFHAQNVRNGLKELECDVTSYHLLTFHWMFKNQTCIDSFIESLEMFESDMFNIKVIENKITQVEMQERTASNFILFSWIHCHLTAQTECDLTYFQKKTCVKFPELLKTFLSIQFFASNKGVFIESEVVIVKFIFCTTNKTTKIIR